MKAGPETMLKMDFKVLAFVLLLFCQGAFASWTNIGFKRKLSNSLQYSTAAQSLYSGNCSGAVTVKTYNTSGVLTNVASNLTVNLTGAGTTTFYSDDTCTNAITNVTVTSGTNSATFYFIETGASPITVTSAAAGYASAIQTQTLSTNPFVWVGLGGDANWNTAANWSGGVVPGASNAALFNNACVSNCSPTINTNISVERIRTTAGYSGTITQAATRTITLGGGGWMQMGGNFAGNNANITVNGPLVINAGSFTSTSATLLVKQKLTISGTGVYNHNNGMFTANWGYGYFELTTAATTFYNVTFSGYAFSVNVNGTINIDADLVCYDTHGAGGSINVGTINLKGNVSLTGGQWNNGGTATLRMVGSGTQTITMAGVNNYLPALEIASTGTVVFSGQVGVRGPSYTYTSGTVTTTGSTFRLYCYHSTCTANPGTITYNHLEIYSDAGTLNLAAGSTFKVAGNLTTNEYYGLNYGLINTGTIEVAGNYSSNYNFRGGSGLIRMNGTGTITTVGGTPKVEINTAGTITISGTSNFRSDLTYVAGTVVTTGSTVNFDANNASQTLNTGAIVFNNVQFTGDNQISNITGTMNVGGNLTISPTSSSSINTGTFAVQGNVSMTTLNSGGTAALSFTGTGAQSVSRTGGAWPTGNWTVNKSGGTLTLGSAVTLSGGSQAVNLTAGAINMAGYAFSMKSLSLNGNTLTKSSGVLTVNGAVQGTGSLFGGTVAP